MSSRGGFAYPDVEQSTRFHAALMRKLGVAEPDPVDEKRLASTLDRSLQMAQQQRGDILSLATMLLYGLIKDKPFGARSPQTGMALTLAFLLRNGVGVFSPDDEIAAVAMAVARGELFVGTLEPWFRESARALQ